MNQAVHHARFYQPLFTKRQQSLAKSESANLQFWRRRNLPSSSSQLLSIEMKTKQCQLATRKIEIELGVSSSEALNCPPKDSFWSQNSDAEWSELPLKISPNAPLPSFFTILKRPSSISQFSDSISMIKVVVQLFVLSLGSHDTRFSSSSDDDS